MSHTQPLGPMMSKVAEALLGTPNKELSKPNHGELRFGSLGSMQVNVHEGWFHDHESKVKGGVLELIKYKAGVANNADAFNWLEEHGIKEKEGPISHFFDYQDEAGVTLYRVEKISRGGSKTFRQHGPDGRGGFACKKGCMQTVRRVLYRLPQIIAAPLDKVIFYCEGEKDADRLISLGLVATTHVGGASNYGPSLESIRKHLSGRRVILLQDNDEAGAKHVADGLALLRDIAAVCAPLLLEGLPAKGDVSDWLNDCGSVEALEALSLAAFNCQPPRGELSGSEDGFADVGGEYQGYFPTWGNSSQEVAAPYDGAKQSGGTADHEGVSLTDFRAYMPSHNYIFMPAGELWPASSVNSRIARLPLVDPDGEPVLDEKGKPKSIAAATWLDQHKPVEQMTWAPGEPQIVVDRLITDGGWISRPGCNVFNLYRPPSCLDGDAHQAAPWVEHIRRIYPEDADHLIKWLAHRCQRPQEKINHAIVLGGAQGIGKDTILEPVKAAIGPWNCSEVSPQQMLGRFNGFVKSVILRVSEARDLGDVDRFAFYDHAKTYTAAPPDVLRVDEKNLREYSVFNVCGVIITTNHKTDGIYLPADDRRHYVAWSDATRDEFPADYWTNLYGWFDAGGKEHVAAYLRTLPLHNFDAKAPPPKTPAFWDIVASNRAPEDAELADALDSLGHPDVVTVALIAKAACSEFREFLTDRRNNRRIPHRFEECGYVAVRNNAALDGMFKVGGKRCTVYARKVLPLSEQIAAANALVRR